MSKGSRQRPSQITATEEDLRWELAFKCKDNPERKKEILAILAGMEDMESGGQTITKD